MEVVFVLKNGIIISVHADSIGKHLFLVIEKGIGAEILSEINVLVDEGCSSIATGSTVAVVVAAHMYLLLSGRRLSCKTRRV